MSTSYKGSDLLASNDARPFNKSCNCQLNNMHKHLITILALLLLLAACSSTPTSTTKNHGGATPSNSKEFSVKIYGNWCGPNHPIRKPGAADPGVVDYVDRACKAHDLCYEKKGYFNCECDMQLVGNIQQIEQIVRTSRGTPTSSLYGPESLASAATQLYYSLPVCSGDQFAVKAALSPFLLYRTGAGIIGGAAAEIITLPLKGLWYAVCPFSLRGCENGP